MCARACAGILGAGISEFTSARAESARRGCAGVGSPRAHVYPASLLVSRGMRVARIRGECDFLGIVWGGLYFELVHSISEDIEDVAWSLYLYKEEKT